MKLVLFMADINCTEINHFCKPILKVKTVRSYGKKLYCKRMANWCMKRPKNYQKRVRKAQNSTIKITRGYFFTQKNPGVLWRSEGRSYKANVIRAIWSTIMGS